MIREVIGFDIPPSYGLDDVERYRNLLEEYQETFRQEARNLGFLAHMEGLWLKEEDLHGGLPTHFLLESVGRSDRSSLTEHKIELPASTKEQLIEAMGSVLELYRHNGRIGPSIELDELGAYLQRLNNPSMPLRPPGPEIRVR